LRRSRIDQKLQQKMGIISFCIKKKKKKKKTKKKRKIWHGVKNKKKRKDTALQMIEDFNDVITKLHKMSVFF